MEETNIKLNVRAIAANKNLSVEALAETYGLDPVHLRNVSLGRATMTAHELMTLAEAAGVSPYNIRID